MLKRFLSVAISIFCLIEAHAQLTPEYIKSTPAQIIYGLRADYGSTVVQEAAVKAIGGAHPYGFGFEISKQAKDSATYHLCSAFPRVGVEFQYFHYGTPIVGNSYMVSYFIQPVYRLNNTINFFYRGSVGMSYSDNPFNPASKIDTLNQEYSLRINPYLQVAIGFGFRLSPHLSLDICGTFDHISNGNWKRPNRGLNWTTAAFTLIYSPSGSFLPKLHRIHDKYWKTRPWNYTFGALYVNKQGYAGFTAGYQRLYAAGGFVEASKQIGRIHGFVAGIQSYYNDLKVDPPNPLTSSSPLKHSSVLAGVYAGHEFLMGRFILSQVLGLYITPHYGAYTNLFHQHSLRYLIDKHWQVGFALKAHKAYADFVCWNVLYRL
jgi:hypothetical protein